MAVHFESFAVRLGRTVSSIRALSRVGLWLWSVDVGKDDYGIIPKFRINERMAHKDRILLAAKYPSGLRMKGLDIRGATENFIVQ
jgi:hypothetical protein